MGRLPPAVARCRVAVRQALRPLVRGGQRPLVLVACSGGPDSLALAATASFVGPRLGLGVGLATVDHGLQPSSAQQAEKVAGWARDEGLVPVIVTAVTVAGYRGGPEAAARQARYAALAQAAAACSAAAVLLGHTQDDQAETVLLALARGGGLRGLAAMPPSREAGDVRWIRPLLGISRADTRGCCDALGLKPWEDPHNRDPAHARARVRAALPLLIEALGPGVVANLARTAQLAAADSAVLDDLAAGQAAATSSGAASLSVAALSELPAAVLTRVLRRYAHELGVPAGALALVHIDALAALVTSWRGQGPVALPGGVWVRRCNGRIEPHAGPVAGHSQVHPR